MKIRLILLLLLGAVSAALAEPLSGPVLERYEQMLLRAPEPGAAFDKIHQHYLETEGLDALGLRWTQASEKSGAPKGDYLLLLGLLNDRRGKTDDALKFLRAAAEAGDNWRAWSALAAGEARAGKLESAAESYKKAIAFNPPKDAAAKLYRGLALCQQRLMDAEGAVETWRAYVKASPGDVFVIEEAGDALLEAGRYDEARAMYGQLRDLKDVDPAKKLAASLKLADVERLRGNKDEALKIYNAALAESGDASWLQREVRSRIERLFRADDDLPGLVKYYQERLKTTPGDLEAVLRLSETLTDLNRHEESLKVLEDAASRAPDNKDVQLRLAAALLRAERPADAEKTLLALSKSFPGDSAITTQLGNAQWQSFKLGKGGKEVALATWRTLAPEDADAMAIQRLAEIFRVHELVGETLAEYRRALAADPSANDRRERLAEYLMELDRKDEAMKELLGLVEGGRAGGENYLRLARIQRRFGDTAAAKKSLEAAVKFEDRAFDRQFLAWQIASEEKDWKAAEGFALAMRQAAQTDPEIERADDSFVETIRQLNRSDAEIARLLAAQKEPGKFTGRDYRLLFILATEAGDNGSAEFALIEGLRSFPKSAPLARLDNAHARRIGDMARRITALERLEQIEPQRAGDWMAERVRAYRDAERWDEAASLARLCVQASPARPEAHILLADTLIAADKSDDAVKALQDAIRLSDNPNQIRFRLADLYLAQGQSAAARGVLDEAFEAEETPAGKLQLTGRLASVYLQEGKIDDLLAKMRERQKAEQGGWRYALYLAEIYLMMQDTVRAMEELDKALAGKPDDPILLKKLHGLAETNGDTESALRYARKLAETEPSKRNRAELGEALAKDGKLDEALELIKNNSSEFLEDPDAWKDAVRLLQADDKAGDLAGMLEAKLRSTPDDWRSLMALGELLVAAGQAERAADIFWQVMAAREDSSGAAAPAPTPAPFSPPPVAYMRRGIVYPGMTGGMPASQTRQMRFSETYQRVMQALSNHPDNMARHSRRTRFPGMVPASGGQSSLADAQDEAIVHLACLAMRDGRDAEFIKKLAGSLQDRTVEERLTIYNLLQAPDAAVDEIRRFVDAGPTDAKTANAAYQALQMILGNRQNNRQIAAASISEDEAKKLMARLGETMAGAASASSPSQRYQLLLLIGKKDEAEKLVDEILASANPDDAAELNTAMQFALMRRDYDKALELNGRLKTLRQKNGAVAQPGMNFGLAMQLINTDTHKARGIDLMAEEFMAPGGGPPALVYGGYGRQQVTWPQLRSSVAQILPLPTADLNQQQVMLLRNVAAQNPMIKKSLPEVISRFEQLGTEKDSNALRQAAIWMRWFSGDEKKAGEALKDLIAKNPSDDLLLNYSLMLVQNKKPDEALKVVAQIRSGSGDTHDTAARLRLALALQVKDQDLARQAARKLAALRLVGYEQSELVQEMRRLNLKEEAARLEKKTVVSRQPRQRSRQTFEVMRQRMEQGNREEALALAYAMLARDPFSRAVRDDRYQQETALRVLDKFDELKGYVARLQEQLKAAPQSARLNAQLAQALQIKDPRDAVPYYRALAELRPRDGEWQRELGTLLMRANQDEEAMKLYDRLIEQSPDLLYAQGTDFLEPYRRTKSWPRLVAAIAKSPEPKADPVNPYRQNYSHIFTQIGRELQRARPPVDPSDVWLKGLRWDESGALQLRPMLAQSLQRAGREAEARKVIEEAFFPPGRDESTARLFVYNRQFRPNTLWGQTISYGNEVESAAMRMMRTAASLGFLEELMPRFQKLPVSPDGTSPAMLARLVVRDEKVLPEIGQLLEKMKAAKPGVPMPGNLNMNTLRMLIGELANWPQGRATAYKALEAASRMAEVFGNDHNSRMSLELQRAEMALEDDRKDEAKNALRNWIKASEDWRRQGAQVDGQLGCKVLRMMAAAGLSAEAKQLVENLKSDPNFSRNSYYERMLRQTENEIAIMLGQGAEATAAVVWIPGGENGGRVIWDLRGSGGGERNDRTVWMSDTPLGKLAGAYTLDVYFGEDETSMRRLFSKANVPARGSWSGKLPQNRGYLRAVLRKGEEMRFGPSMSVASGKVLFPADSLREVPQAKGGTAKGWTNVPPVPISLEKGGPTGNDFVRLEGDRQNETELIGERVPVTKDRNYQVGCWFRFRDNQGGARVGWRVYDGKGRELNNYSGNGNFRGDRWNYAVQNFGRGDNSYGLQDEAAFIEPYVSFNGRVDVQDMFVTEIDGEARED